MESDLSIKPKDLAKYIDHTSLAATATSQDIEVLCNEAAKFGFKSVCVNPIYVKLANKKLESSSVIPITVVGFPLGANGTRIKSGRG